MEQKEIKRSEAYIALRERLFNIFKYSYIVARLDLQGEELTKLKQRKKIHKFNKKLKEKIAPVISKWNDLTLAECGKVYTLSKLIAASNIEAGIVIKKAKDKEVLRAECEARLKEIMPKPKRKRITAVKVSR